MPIGILSPSPTFNQFWSVAHKAQPDERLIFDKGNVSNVSKNYRFGDLENETNKKTWEAFSKAVTGAFSPEKIKWICQRYFNKESLPDLINSSGKLERHHVACFGVGAASALKSDLEYAARPWYMKVPDWISERYFNKKNVSDLSKCSVEEVKSLYDRATAHGDLFDPQKPHTVHGSPREMLENFFFNPFKMDQQRSNLFGGIADLVSKDPLIPRMHPYYSRLSMAITCLFENPTEAVDPEFIIPAPGVKDGEMDFYRVYKVISEGGLTAVALVPVSDSSTLQPIISFRCTKQALWQKGFFDSNLDNMDEQMGKKGFEESKDKLRQLMADPKFSQGKKIKVLAYSQGGGHAGHFLNDVLGKYWRKIDEFIGFNFIGNDSKKVPEEEWVIPGIAKQVNAIPKEEDAPKFTIYRNIGDWVNGSGIRHVGWGIKHPNSFVRVFEWIIDDYPVPLKDPEDSTQRNIWFNLHGVRPMDAARTYTNPYKYNLYQGRTQCDPILDTYKRDPTLEDIRQKFGHEVIYRSLTTILRIIDLIARIFGISFLKKYVEGHSTKA